MYGEMNCDRCDMVHRFPEPIRKHVVEILKTGQVCKELINYDNILLYLEVSCISRPLKTACEEKLLECVAVMNTIDALQIAEKYELLLLKKEAIELIADHFKNLWHTDSFVDLHELSLERICQVEKVFKHDDVFRALEKWLNRNHENRLMFYGKLLHLVQKQRSPRKYFDSEKTYHLYHAMILPSVLSKYTIEVAVFNCDGDLVCHRNLFKSHDVKDRFSVACAQKDETEAPYVYIAFEKHVVRYDPVLLKHENCHNLNHQRSECSLVVLGDFIYALGGHHNGNNVSEIEELDTKHHRNKFLIKKSWKTIAHLPDNVKLSFAPCMTFLNKIYIVAELLSNENIKSTGLLTFDPNEKSVEIVAIFLKKCSDCRAVLYDSKVFIASSEGYFLQYDIETKTFSSCKDLPTKGTNFGMYAARNNIYFVGASVSDNNIDRFEKDGYDIQTNSWKRERKLPCNLPIYGSCDIKVPSYTNLIPFNDSR
ncbi:kelch-like protein 12 isoform X1 [Mytilus trossulus]|uniref:kelch-like protein 12 isoform X1 n=1 Tax=Mytilus trossulus TaxID=6551 RepID=UPI00300640BF